ncbi:zinc-binding dehydrogenase [Salisediminibacterium halotolerans]|uniref:zinc-binding dehydrogenase n=1 Tax=Salisediminibacterium halotolerans TaxID=517425 RepID=UPI000EB500B5|nr:zinc-binding dehydrogenase [Salisediminibacterium halotolerans]RLJ81082.1 zinc-binding alcohol dehydrogenase/oxidoreductase [Actinophytocola xinjiangensis]RPE84109.1 zinc-binding alcohol dehydrogenase/oxidoreductase [Salisediminibacterium halotolerans]TWG38509.1 zinc-binding alcohol dehydrogenase/oxidoreductase [Salisediminibacterium halotolerans]GEL08659.1 alcohol dehydrogenase [Salisediminibacterium halotolerans]
MFAFIHEGTKGLEGTRVDEIETEQLNSRDVQVKIKTAGLNHRDLFVLQLHDSHAGPLIVGSDAAGIVEDTGDDVSRVKVGDEVVINPSMRWFEKSDAPPDDFRVLGLPDHGTFAETITISEDQLEPKPAHLTWEEAGVLSLAALTAFRALFTRSNLQAGETVFLPGVGSGAVTFMVQFAKVAGARVIASSRSAEKREEALKLGADRVIDSNSDWADVLKDETIDVAVETVGAATFNKTLAVLRKGGTMTTFGASAGDKVELDIRAFFYGQYNLLGTTMGSRDELQEMLAFIERHEIRPVMDTSFPLDEAHKAFKRLEEAKQFGKISLNISK